MKFYRETQFRQIKGWKIPKDWEIVNLTDVLQEVDLRVNEIHETDDLILFSLTRKNGLIPQETRFSKRIARKDVGSYKVIKRGWLVYNPYVIWEGAIDILKSDQPGLISPVYITWETKKKAHYLFLDYLLKTNRMLSTFFNLSTGVVNRRRSIAKDTFVDIHIPLPPILEQQRIAEILGTLDEGILHTDASIAKIKNLRMELMHELLTKGIGHSEFLQTPIGKIPKAWKVVKLGDYLDLCQYGLSFAMSYEGKYPIIRMNEIVDGYVVPPVTKKINLDRRIFEKYKLNKGDILFNRTNSYKLVGKTGIFLLKGDYVFASYLVRLRTKERLLDPLFLTFYLLFASNRLKRQLATRAVQQVNINATKLKTFKIPLPSVKEQQKITEIILAIDNELRIDIEYKEKLEKVRKGLMSSLLKGKTRIKVS